jgi:hypothetical protein
MEKVTRKIYGRATEQMFASHHGLYPLVLVGRNLKEVPNVLTGDSFVPQSPHHGKN